MTVGNVMGSNLLNVLFVVGTLSIIQPITVDAETLRVHFPVMLAFCALLVPITWFNHKISRLEGGFMVACFAGYMMYLYL